MNFSYLYNNNFYDPAAGGYSTPNTISFSFMPNAGYFILDKFATGLKLNYSVTNSERSESSTMYGVSPFVRYYFLPVSQKVNVFAETAYGWNRVDIGNGNSVSHNWSFSAGPAIFVTQHVALQFALNFTTYSAKYYNGVHPGVLGLNVGFQIHLGK